MADLVGRRIAQKALFVGRQIADAPSGYYAAVWFGDLKASDLPVPVDTGSPQSVVAFLNGLGASAVIFPVATSPIPDQLFDRVITWGHQLHYTEGPPAETPRPTMPEHSPT
ncbi:MAG TPA: hypothetical protein VMQ54_15120 [Steroidobacteraceae bacterium]|nr:hypothetical protein [Steroidobacteraceae bacterium]